MKNNNLKTLIKEYLTFTKTLKSKKRIKLEELFKEIKKTEVGKRLKGA